MKLQESIATDLLEGFKDALLNGDTGCQDSVDGFLDWVWNESDISEALEQIDVSDEDLKRAYLSKRESLRLSKQQEAIFNKVYEETHH
jgi:hypothetical protein